MLKSNSQLICGLCREKIGPGSTVVKHKEHGWHDDCLANYFEAQKEQFLPCPHCQEDLIEAILIDQASLQESRSYDICFHKAFLDHNADLVAAAVDNGFKPVSELHLEALLRFLGAHQKSKAICDLYRRGHFDRDYALNLAFLRACEKGELGCIDYFLRLGVDINFDKCRALRTVVIQENGDVIRHLVKRGAKIDMMVLDDAAKLPRREIYDYLKLSTIVPTEAIVRLPESKPEFDEELRALLKCIEGVDIN